MSFIDRNVYAYKAREAVKEFGARGIALPETVTAAVKVMDRVAAAKPVQPSHTAIREAILADADQAQIDRLLLADLAYTRHQSEWAQAHIDAAGAVLRAIRDAAHVLMPKLRKQADACISKLAQVAALGGVRLEHLVRAGRQSEAAVLAAADTIAAELSTLYGLRDTYLVRGGGTKLTIAGVSCARWRDPDAAAQHVRGKTVAEQFISGLAGGCQLWFPSPTEAVEAAQAIADQRAAAAEDRRKREHGVGFPMAFMGG